MKIRMKALAALALAALTALPLGARAEEGAENDQKVRLEALEEAVEGLTKKTEELSMMYIEGFTDLRYDDERRPNQNAGLSGMFVRRAEIKMSGNVSGMPAVVWSLGYDFTENKHKDVGVEIKDISFIPFWDVMPEYTWSLRLGQYRMPFGIVPQTSSSSISFAERPGAFGGKSNAGSQVSFTALFKERAMGAQLRHVKKYENLLGYDLQLGAFNNVSEDQAVGKNKIGAADAFPAQVTDQDFSPVARLATTWDFLNFLLPEKSKLQTGVSYARDSQNTAWMAQNNAAIKYDEYLGAELVFQFGPRLFLQSEYVKMADDISALLGLNVVKEGWYADLGLDLLPWFMEAPAKGDALQVLARLDEQSNYAAGSGGFTFKASRLGGGLKWSYGGGKNHTAINYFVTAPDQMFGGDYRSAAGKGIAASIQAPETLLIIQQQFAFETGKPK